MPKEEKVKVFLPIKGGSVENVARRFNDLLEDGVTQFEMANIHDVTISVEGDSVVLSGTRSSGAESSGQSICHTMRVTNLISLAELEEFIARAKADARERGINIEGLDFHISGISHPVVIQIR